MTLNVKKLLNIRIRVYKWLVNLDKMTLNELKDIRDRGKKGHRERKIRKFFL